MSMTLLFVRARKEKQLKAFSKANGKDPISQATVLPNASPPNKGPKQKTMKNFRPFTGRGSPYSNNQPVPLRHY